MNIMPNCYRKGLALALGCFLGLSGFTPALAAVPQTSGDKAVVSALKIQAATPQTTRIMLEGSARLDYNVVRPGSTLVSIDLFDADTSSLQANYAVGNGLVETVQVKPIATGKGATRIEVGLSKPCDVRSYLISGSNTLVLEFTSAAAPDAAPKPAPGGAMSFAGAASARTPSKASGPLALQKIDLEKRDDVLVATLRSNGPLGYTHFALHDPERIVVNVPEARNLLARKTMDVGFGMVERIRVGAPDPKTTRIVFDLRESSDYEIAEAEDRNGVVVRIANKKSQPAASLKPAAASDVASENAQTVTSSPASSDSAAPAPRALRSAPSPEEGVKTDSTPETSVAKKSADVQPAALTIAPPKAESAPAASGSAKRRRPQNGGPQFGDPGYQGDPISLDITGIDLADILRFISDNYDVNFVLDKSVGKVPVTIKVNQVPWTQVVESIFKANSLAYRREGMIIRVASIQALTQEEDDLRKQRQAAILNSPLVTEYFKIKYERIDQNAAQTANQGGGANQNNNNGVPVGTIAGIGIIGIIQQNLSAVGRVSINPRTNTLIITDIPGNIEKVRDVVARLDVPEPQVEIEARVVVADRNFTRDLGVQLFTGVVSQRGGGVAFSSSAGQSTNFNFAGMSQNQQGQTGLIRGTFRPRDFVSDSLFIGPTAGTGISGGPTNSILSLTTGLIGTGFISSAISANETKGIVKTISAPRVTVQNNSSATINSGTQIPFVTSAGIGQAGVVQTVVFQDANLSLNITPQITSEGNVLLRLNVTNDSPGAVLNGLTAINRRNASTIVLVPDGGTTIVGGTLVDLETNIQNRTPGISSLPLLGELFKRRTTMRQTTELLFFITPRIYRGENFTIGGEPSLPAPAPKPASAPAPTPTQTGGQP
jgi:type IV pilus assembly protein PilQ